MQSVQFFAATDSDASALHLVDEANFGHWQGSQSALIQQWLTANAFRPERYRHLLLPDASGKAAAVVLGLGKPAEGATPYFWYGAAAADRLPAGRYRLTAHWPSAAVEQFAQGWAYGHYQFARRKAAERAARVLLVDAQVDLEQVARLIDALSLARDLINMPASELTPTALAEQVATVGITHRARVRRYRGEALLAQGFPAVHAVGRAAAAAPELVDFDWGQPDHPRVTLVGKGVCFDSGGLDIKPSAGMLLMKKDMGGAACTLALAQLIMQANLPVRLRVIIPAVENAIAGNAFRPGDVLATRAGLTVEVGNTDAEGRLILGDALSLADEDAPDLLIDMATLTGAARVALGPELPALFTRDTALAQQLMQLGERESDPLWHLPLWPGYDDELASRIADLNNVSSSGFSGAIIGGLYLQRFVTRAKQWLHIDLYAWNSKDRPGRPLGGEAQCVRLLFAYLAQRFSR